MMGLLLFTLMNCMHDLTAAWLQKFCHDVAVEPPLQPHGGESISPTIAFRGGLLGEIAIHAG